MPSSIAPAWPRLLPLLATLVGAGIVTASAAPMGDLARFGLAFLWCCTVPGVAAHRALRGRPDTLLEDLTWGTCLGLIVALAGWACCVGLGVPALQLAWPALVVALTLAFPAGRRRVLDASAYPRHLDAGTAAGAGVLTMLGLALAQRQAWAPTQLPPGASAWYQDLYWYLGQVAELGRHVIPLDAQAGDPFRYHWYSMAHMATLAQVSGAPVATVVGRLWLVPFVPLVVGVLISLGLQLSGRGAVGVLAGAFTLLGAQLCESTFYTLPGFEAMVYFSPSQVFGIPVLGLLLAVAFDLVRGRGLRRGDWAVLGLAALASPGSKSSILPTVVCALALVTLLLALGRRAWRRCAVALGVVLVAMVVSLPLSQGGDAGTGIQLFAVLGSTTPWKTQLGGIPIQSFHDRVLWLATSPAGLTMVGLLLVAYAVHAAWVLPALPLLRRLGPAAWLLAGLGIAGFSAMLLINHDGLSQIYFLRGVIPFVYLLGAWGAVDAAGEHPDRRFLALGAAVAVPLVALASRLEGHPGRGGVPGALALGLGAIVVPAVVAAMFAARGPLRRRPAWRQGLVGALVVASLLIPARNSLSGFAVPAPEQGTLGVFAFALLACGLVAAWPAGRRVACACLLVAAMSLSGVAFAQQRARDAKTPSTASGASADETAAAAWIAEHAAPDDLVATNVHCQPKTKVSGCDARGFWVAGLTQRRVLIGGWGYTVQAHQAHGVRGKSSRVQPFHDPALFALNEDAFYDPTPEGLARLRERGVRWLYADAAVAPIAPELGRLVAPAFSRGTATVYRLDATPPSRP